MYLIALERVIIEAILDVFMFPLWWYSAGVVFAFRRVFALFMYGNRELAPFLWLRNIFVPMYGQYDWQGRMISFFARGFQVMVRLVGLILWLIVCTAIFSLWFLVPVYIVWNMWQLVPSIKHV